MSEGGRVASAIRLCPSQGSLCGPEQAESIVKEAAPLGDQFVKLRRPVMERQSGRLMVLGNVFFVMESYGRSANSIWCSTIRSTHAAPNLHHCYQMLAALRKKRGTYLRRQNAPSGWSSTLPHFFFLLFVSEHLRHH